MAKDFFAVIGAAGTAVGAIVAVYKRAWLPVLDHIHTSVFRWYEKRGFVVGPSLRTRVCPFLKDVKLAIPEDVLWLRFDVANAQPVTVWFHISALTAKFVVGNRKVTIVFDPVEMDLCGYTANHEVRIGAKVGDADEQALRSGFGSDSALRVTVSGKFTARIVPYEPLSDNFTYEGYCSSTLLGA